MLHIATPTIQIGGTIQFLLEAKGTSRHATAKHPASLKSGKKMLRSCKKWPIETKGWMRMVKRLIAYTQTRAKLETKARKRRGRKTKEIEKEQTKKEDLETKCKSLVKYKDPGCPTISVMIGETCVEKALLDLGANRSMKIPRGMIEDVLVQLTFSNMTLELNIFYMCNKQFHPEKKKDRRDSLATLPHLKMREEILSLFNEEETQEAVKEEPPKLILKPLPTKLKYAYLEENKQSPVVISSSLTTT
ncbi:hypothetical protein AAG906_021149 [Vitis piasezkii]